MTAISQRLTTIATLLRVTPAVEQNAAAAKLQVDPRALAGAFPRGRPTLVQVHLTSVLASVLLALVLASLLALVLASLPV